MKTKVQIKVPDPIKKIGVILVAALAVVGVIRLQDAFVARVARASTSISGAQTNAKLAWAENIGRVNFSTLGGNFRISTTALTGYAWGEGIGWISLNCSNTGTCGTTNYGVANSSGTLSGYAWSENAGWISFNPTGGGVTVDLAGNFSGYAYGENIGWIYFAGTASPVASTGAVGTTLVDFSKIGWATNAGWLKMGASGSVLTGYAWGEDIGWISMNCLNTASCGSTSYAVTKDGAGNLSGYAWSENVGWISFNPTGGGVTMDVSGNLSGYAWGENIGWVRFTKKTATINSAPSLIGQGSLGTNGLVGWWTFDGADTHWTSSTAGTVTDKSGSGNTGTLTNMSQTTSPVAGKVGQGLKFNGTSQAVTSTIPTTAVNNITMAGWFYWTGTALSTSLPFYNGNSGANGYGLFISDGTSCGVGNKVSVLIGGSVCNGLNSTAYTMPSNIWTHLVIKRDAGVWYLFVNGKLQIIGGSGTPNTPTLGYVTGGAYTTGPVVNGFFPGKIDDVRVYNRALSSAEVQQLYNMGK